MGAESGWGDELVRNVRILRIMYSLLAVGALIRYLDFWKG